MTQKRPPLRCLPSLQCEATTARCGEPGSDWTTPFLPRIDDCSDDVRPAPPLVSHHILSSLAIVATVENSSCLRPSSSRLNIALWSLVVWTLSCCGKCDGATDRRRQFPSVRKMLISQQDLNRCLHA